MALGRNVGGLDRLARGVVGVALVGAAVGAFVTGRESAGIASGLVGAGLLFNAVSRFCGVNALLGIDTCSRRE